MSLEGALLGLISSMEPVSGYELAKAFELSMTHYWHARHGQIYPTLKRLRRRGLVTISEVRQPGRPTKKLYSITPEGKAELVRWLSTPPRPLQMKHEGLLKCRFYFHLPLSEAMRRLEEERSGYEALLERYRRYESEYFSSVFEKGDPDVLFAYFTLRRGILFLEESIRWCDWVREELRSWEEREKRRQSRRRRIPRARG
ncbi:MAG: PadR family transcriptional regulator [Candidatus Binatia bacterium]|nr:MAG: PadR family transcriptional regulator [Candidatus Binatia bacterium]